MTKRDHKIAQIKIAGYHNDRRGFTRAYIGGRMSHDVAMKAWDEGQKARAAGVGCSCAECNAT